MTAKDSTHKVKKGREHVSEAKQKAVQDLKKLIEQYPVIAIINLENLPAKQVYPIPKPARPNRYRVGQTFPSPVGYPPG